MAYFSPSVNSRFGKKHSKIEKIKIENGQRVLEVVCFLPILKALRAPIEAKWEPLSEAGAGIETVITGRGAANTIM